MVIMGGSIERGYGADTQGKPNPPQPEWNIRAIPAGAKALLASGVPVFMMPLDSTQVHLEPKGAEAIFAHGSPLTDQLTLLYHQWMAGHRGTVRAPTLFDPVAVTYAIRPDLCPATPMHIEVDDKGFTRRGAWGAKCPGLPAVGREGVSGPASEARSTGIEAARRHADLR